MRKLYYVFILSFFSNITFSQIVNIPDQDFRNVLMQSGPFSGIARDSNGTNISVDSNSDGIFEMSELSRVSTLNVSASRISNFEGIQHFVNLQYLNCNTNRASNLDVSSLQYLKSLECHGFLTTLNLGSLPNLEKVDCSDGRITSLDVSNLPNLKHLNVSDNSLTSLNVSNLAKLEELYCTRNRISPLDVSNLTRLRNLYCSENIVMNTLTLNNCPGLFILSCEANNLETLDISTSPGILTLYCGSNQIQALDVSRLRNLQTLNCYSNQLQTLDVSNCVSLELLLTQMNPQLKSLFLKNGNSRTNFYFDGPMPSLEYICVDDSRIQNMKNYIIRNGGYNCEVNSYCSFVPGGSFFNIQGKNSYDADNNGCDVSDNVYKNMKFSITTGTQSNFFISNSNGQFSIPVLSGTHTITPNLENPIYFTVSPASVTVSFPSQSSPLIQDFCISPNGVYSDLEITILPITPARPGFDMKYKIFYKNKGTHTQTGAVNVSFNGAIIDFVLSNPMPVNNLDNSLGWNFENLLPFETREILLTLNLNSPTENPAVNSGDILNFEGTISGSQQEETPLDNSFVLNQIVVNSFDPNNKTCLEGSTISSHMVGKYLHYIIKFENTGNFPAENIVVKDVIDTTKFDILSLIPTSSSHNFITKISQGKNVEFIFENINLPFNDEDNDGYIAFKIKTKPTLIVGDVINNDANIYFDYNFPIVTDVFATTISALSTNDHNFDNFVIYPNPVNETLLVQSKNELKIDSIEVYNIQGQMLLRIEKPEDKINVSKLQTGSYFIKVYSANKIQKVMKFIKK